MAKRAPTSPANRRLGASVIMGRPALSEDRRRRAISVTLSPDALEALQRLADAWRTTASAAVDRAVLAAAEGLPKARKKKPTAP